MVCCLGDISYLCRMRYESSARIVVNQSLVEWPTSKVAARYIVLWITGTCVLHTSMYMLKINYPSAEISTYTDGLLVFHYWYSEIVSTHRYIQHHTSFVFKSMSYSSYVYIHTVHVKTNSTKVLSTVTVLPLGTVRSTVESTRKYCWVLLKYCCQVPQVPQKYRKISQK